MSAPVGTSRFAVLAILAGIFLAAPASAEAPQGPAGDVPELKVLEHRVGEWDVEMTIKPADGPSGGIKAKGTAKAEWVLDGRFVQSTWTMEGEDGSPPMKGISLMTYDPGKKAYRGWMFLSNGSVSQTEGRWDDKTRTMTLKARDPQGGSSTVVESFAEDGTQTWTIVEKDRDGRVLAEVTGTNTRSKAGPRAGGRAGSGAGRLVGEGEQKGKGPAKGLAGPGALGRSPEAFSRPHTRGAGRLRD